MIKHIWYENEIDKLARTIHGYKSIALVSGYFHPAPHKGHISMINDAKNFAHLVVCLVNGTATTIAKYGHELIPVEQRLANLAEYRSIDYVLEWDFPDVSEAIRRLYPHVFCNGGDRSLKDNTINPEEILACQEVNCRIVCGVGGYDKVASNSDFLKKVN